MPRDTRGQLVEKEMLTLPVWDRFDAATAEAVARAVERCLPEPWKFARVARHEVGDQKRHVAFFNWNDAKNEAEFALIPGGEVVLGFDPGRRGGPPRAVVKRWEKEARTYEGWEDITWTGYLTKALTPLRTASVAPFLLCTEAKRRQPSCDTGEAFRAVIREWGLRLPTADEWEYACSAGSRTLWHWDDDPKGGPVPVNAFGLVIAGNTYHQEAIDPPGDYRGGDGGVREHGGANDLECKVPLWSWFHSSAEPSQEDWWQFTLYRPVFPLPPETLG